MPRTEKPSAHALTGRKATAMHALGDRGITSASRAGIDVMARRNALGVPGAANDVKAGNRKGRGAPKPGGSRSCRPQQLRRHQPFAQRLCPIRYALAITHSPPREGFFTPKQEQTCT